MVCCKQKDKKSKVAELESSLRDAQSRLSDLDELQALKQVLQLATPSQLFYRLMCITIAAE